VREERLGKEYWRSLDELADTPEYRALVEDEFPGLAQELLSPRTRRAFLKIMGASLGVAGLASCRWPKELILPFAHRAQDRTPGVPQQFATAMELGGAATGLLVTSYDGRPTKIEGNPLHPTSHGTATALAQASLLEVYDPDRSTTVIRREGEQIMSPSWDDFTTFAGAHFSGLRVSRGAGLAVLSEQSSSPSLARLRARFHELFPEARWYEWESISRDSEREGTKLLFGQPYRPQYDLGRAEVIVCLDADPIFDHPAALQLARGFASRRRAEDGTMNRLYVVEPVVSLTGSMADHRVSVPASVVPLVAASLLAEVSGLLGSGLGPVPGADLFGGTVKALITTMAGELVASRGKGAVLAGYRQGPEVHALVHALNAMLGNVGTTLAFTAEPDPERPTHVEAMRAAVDEMGRGSVSTLVILGGNPAYDAPRDLDFPRALEGVATKIHLSAFDDETSKLCQWHLPRAHYLETWGDVRAWDGTVSVQQPLIEALYGGRSPIEVVALFLGEATVTGHEIVRTTLSGLAKSPDFEVRWRRTLHDGVLEGSATARVEPEPSRGAIGAALERVTRAARPSASGTLEAVFVPDNRMYDGRFTNNAWLQELADNVTKLTWDNAALLSYATATRLGVKHGDVIVLKHGGRSLEIATYVMPGQDDGTVVLPLGYARTAAGRVGNGVGFDTYGLRTSEAIYRADGVVLETTSRTHVLACTHDHYVIDTVGLEERGKRVGALVREGTLAEYKADPSFATEKWEAPKSLPLFDRQKYTGEHQWGMSIDLTACIGCNACVVACQAENNTPVVGKDQVVRHREMHWITVDRYFQGKPESPNIAFQPLPCQQCENAPCEEVCPVAATMHSDEGLNEQVYNRCVGTRYCSNNCPYKVRRFNFFNYFLHVPEVEKMVFNPEVTVRSRGVMEKCTFCIQRIEAVKIAAGNEKRPIRDGEIVPACAQTCPTQAIVFGDLKDPNSRVTRLHRDDRAYGILMELATRPRNLYLARLRNPSPKVKDGA
jgi:MoCo/4Fe-4S cofactor protein with predicted Tat translocation signal